MTLRSSLFLLGIMFAVACAAANVRHSLAPFAILAIVVLIVLPTIHHGRQR